MMFFLVSDFLNKSICKEVDKKYTGCNLKTMELLECVPIGVCVVIRSNMVVMLRNTSCGCS